MIETEEQRQRRIGCYMAAFGRLLCGRPVTPEEIGQAACLAVGGSAVNFETMMHWGDWTRRHGRPIIHVSPTEGAPAVPTVALVAHVDGRTHIVENCMLWMGRRDDRARLIPDRFDMGAFAFGADLRLERLDRAPVSGFKAGQAGMRRAYETLLDLEVEQRRSGGAAPLPKKMETRLAA